MKEKLYTVSFYYTSEDVIGNKVFHGVTAFSFTRHSVQVFYDSTSPIVGEHWSGQDNDCDIINLRVIEEN